MSSTLSKWRWWPIDLAAVVVCLTITLIVYLIFVSPLVRRSAEQAKQRRELREQHQTLYEQTNNLVKLTDQLAALQAAFDASKLQLKHPERINRHLADLTDLARICRIQINQTEPGRSIRGPRFGTVPITLTGMGSYRDCTSFLHELHERFEDTGVHAFELASNTDQVSKAARFTCELIWFTAPVEDDVNQFVEAERR